jgi:integrase
MAGKGRPKGQKNTNRYGTGTLRKNPNGTWSMWRTIDGRRYKRTGATQADARRAMDALAAELARGERSEPNTATVADIVEQWLRLDLASRDRSPSTVSRHEWAAGKILAGLGRRRAADLTVIDVERFLVAQAGTGLSRASLAKVLNTLSQSLKAARRRGIVTTNVAADAVIPPSAPAKVRPRRSLSPDEARRLLEELPSHRYGLAFALSLRLGLRPGEAFGLHWSDVGDGYVNVTRAVRRDGGRLEVVDELKTASARRTIALPPELVAWIERHRRAQLEERLAARSWADERLLFATRAGGPVDPARSRSELRRACEAAGVTAIAPNELRHSCASLLSDSGIPNELIADLLGHTTTRMVDETYRHRLRPIIDVVTLDTSGKHFS